MKTNDDNDDDDNDADQKEVNVALITDLYQCLHLENSLEG